MTNDHGENIILEAETVPCSVRPIVIDPDKCVGCMSCADICQVDVLLPSPDGGAPIVSYPGECWYCGACVMACPAAAIKLHHPLMNRAKWKQN